MVEQVGPTNMPCGLFLPNKADVLGSQQRIPTMRSTWFCPNLRETTLKFGKRKKKSFVPDKKFVKWEGYEQVKAIGYIENEHKWLYNIQL